MPLPRPAALLVLYTCLWIVLLSGCSTAVRPTAPGLDAQLQQQAQVLESQGNYQGAAALYLDAAARASTPRKEDFLLYAVASLIRGGDQVRATELLDGLPSAQLTDLQKQHHDVNRARLALDDGHPDRVLELLQPVPASGPHAADYRRLRAAAYLVNGDYFNSAQERIALNDLPAEPEQRLENQIKTWEAVSGISDAELQRLRTAPPPDVLSGWMELVELTRLYLQQPDALSEVIPHWQMRYPGHPAGGPFIDELLGSMQLAGQPPAQIALLLPLSGPLAGAGSAIRDGVMAAYYDTSEGILRPQIQIYDVGTDPLAVLETYQRAVAAGAGFVIGPLRKEAVQVLLQQEQLPVPVLALNRVDTQDLTNPGLYQFGLAPEDEAREIARRAWHEGHTRAVALAPQDSWGSRVIAAFSEEWIQQGGELLVQQFYNPQETDHGQAISAALNLDASKNRHQRLVRQLGQSLEYEPRRRQDIDFIFLLATPGQARLIRPQLRFYRASGVPVFSTSHVYTGRPDQGRDHDLNGIVFCDMPWTLEDSGNWQHLKQTISDHWQANSDRYGRFYALGIDAFRITPYLGQLGSGMFSSYHGVTGNLTLDTRQQIHRTLRWARFNEGLPQPLESGEEITAGTTTSP
jgi:outer membrane PBP1 activator LpoA protein